MTKHTANIHNDASAVIQRARYFLEAWERAGLGSTLRTGSDSPGTQVALSAPDLRKLVELATASGAVPHVPTESAVPDPRERMTAQTQALLQRALAEIEYLHKSVMQAAGVASNDGTENSVAVDLRAALKPATTVRRARAKPVPRQPGTFLRDWMVAIRSMPGSPAAGEQETSNEAPSGKS